MILSLKNLKIFFKYFLTLNFYLLKAFLQNQQIISLLIHFLIIQFSNKKCLQAFKVFNTLMTLFVIISDPQVAFYKTDNAEKSLLIFITLNDGNDFC